MTVPSGPAMTVYGDGHTVFTNTVTATAFLVASDARLKKNVERLGRSLETVEALEPVSFDWIPDNSNDIGFIAQEVEAVIPEAVYFEGFYKIEYAKLIPHLVGAVKELSARVKELERRLVSQ
jgi:hypothetical protein